MPTPLSVVAAAMPETWVPWPSSSVGTPWVQAPLRQVALRPETLPRSGCVASTPVSTIPTGTDGLGENVPGKTDQPPRAEIASRAHCEL